MACDLRSMKSTERYGGRRRRRELAFDLENILFLALLQLLFGKKEQLSTTQMLIAGGIFVGKRGKKKAKNGEHF
jgi:hypothetical protein